MSSNNKVAWTEGMFLQPHHFQQQDRFVENWIESRCGGLRSYAWGLSQLEIDEQLLALGKLAVVTCQGVFADGTPFNIPGDHLPPLPLEVPDDCKNEVLYLSLPVHRSGGKEVTPDNDGDELSRYRLRELEVKDQHSVSGNSDATIESGELWVRFRLVRQDPGGFVNIPLARVVERKADAQVILDAHFIPTSLHCDAAPVLRNYIEEIQGLLHHRGESLAQRLGSPGAGGVGEVVDFLLLQIVNRFEPLFTHWVTLRHLHPEALYSTLVQIAGELATITETSRRPVAYPAYVHEDLSACFEPVVAAIRQSLNWVPETRAVPIPLKSHGHSRYTATIHDRQLFHSAIFVLAVKAETSAEKLRQHFAPQVTIATVEKLRDFVTSHTMGIEINPLNVAPRQIPYHAGFTYFELEKNNELWKSLVTSGVIAMHFAGDYPGLELEFWAIRG